MLPIPDSMGFVKLGDCDIHEGPCQHYKRVEYCFRSCPARKQWDCANKCATLRDQIIQLQGRKWCESDLFPGAVFRAATQPATITPTIRNVVVVWVGPLDVHYRYEGSAEVKVTPVARFLEIVNKEKTCK